MRKTKAENELKKLTDALIHRIRDSLQSDVSPTPIGAGITRLGKIEFLYPTPSMDEFEETDSNRLEESLLIRIRQHRYSSAARLERSLAKIGSEIRIHAEHRSRIARAFRIAFRRKRPRRLTLAGSQESVSSARWYRTD
jgi:hypothetical protein